MQIQEWNSMHTIWGEKVHAIVCEIYLLNSTINFYGNWSVEFVQWATICGYYYFNRSLDQRIHFDINEFNLQWLLFTILLYDFSFPFWLLISNEWLNLKTHISIMVMADGWLELNIFKNVKYSQEKGFYLKYFFFICRRQKMVECFIHEWLLFKIHHHIFPLFYEKKIYHE